MAAAIGLAIGCASPAPPSGRRTAADGDTPAISYATSPELALLAPELAEIAAAALPAKPETIVAPAPSYAASAQQGGSARPIDSLIDVISAAEIRYGLPARMIWAMTILESSGGIHACGFNLTGYASCGPDGVFTSYAEGIEVTARTLAGYWLDDAMGKLCIWQNGGDVNPCEYGHNALALMSN